MRVAITVQLSDFDVGAELKALQGNDSGIGAVASFIGTVSQSNDSHSVAALELEHYPGMTEKSIAGIVDEAAKRWRINAVRVIHRVGRLEVGAQIVLVAVGSRHRKDAFNACEYIMDYLKVRAPLWKKEFTEAGPRWLDARVSDSTAAARWDS